MIGKGTVWLRKKVHIVDASLPDLLLSFVYYANSILVSSRVIVPCHLVAQTWLLCSQVVSWRSHPSTEFLPAGIQLHLFFNINTQRVQLTARRIDKGAIIHNPQPRTFFSRWTAASWAFHPSGNTGTVFCPGFQKGRVPSEKGTLARWTDRQKGTLARWTDRQKGTLARWTE